MGIPYWKTKDHKRVEKEEAQRPSLQSVKVKHLIDEWPDTSWIGEYTSRYPGDDALKRGSAFDRKAEGDMGRNEYQYFVPANSVEEHRKGLQKLGYSKGVAEEMARSYTRQDYERMESISRGDICFIGVIAEAVVSYPQGSNCRRIETLTSGGLWGIESDSGEYIKEVEKEQLEDLKAHLSRFNMDTRIFDDIIEYETP